MAVQCVLVGKGKDDVFTAVYGETTFDKVLKAYNEKKVVQVIYQNRIYYLDNTTVVDSPEAFSFISTFSNQNDETGEIKHYAISLMTGDSWSGPFLQKSTPATHANTHAKDGTDPLAPADIGAMELSENILKQSNEDITSQVAQALSKNLVPFSGGTMTGLLNVLTPVGDSNATTKKYVDDALSEKIGMDGIGDLHVWKKTVVYNQPVPEVPGSYTLGSATQLTAGLRNTSTSASSYISNLSVSNEISVDLAGNVTLVNPSTVTLRVTRPASFASDPARTALGGYCYFMATDDTSGEACNMYLPKDQIFYVAENAVYTYAIKAFDSAASFDTAQTVTGIPGTPAIPAGITITYPASTNPNAYQEGNDAKPAGYTLGEVVTGQFKMSERYPSNGYYYKYASSISIADNGTISLDNPSQISLDSYNGGQSYANNCLAKIAGKFMYLSNRGSGTNAPDSKPPFNSVPSAVVYVPSDATLTWTEGGALDGFTLSKYQPVTGYPAIPARTTIEYLGKLGDKTRVQVISYVGTGTYGADNPCSITADFPIKVAISLYHYISGSIFMISDELSVNYTPDKGFDNNNANYSFGKKSHDGKTLTWYSTRGQDAQFNNSGYTYYFLAIG